MGPCNLWADHTERRRNQRHLVHFHMGRCLKERLQKEDKGGHIVLESIIFSLRYKADPQGTLLNPLGGARLVTDRR